MPVVDRMANDQPLAVWSKEVKRLVLNFDVCLEYPIMQNTSSHTRASMADVGHFLPCANGRPIITTTAALSFHVVGLSKGLPQMAGLLESHTQM